MKLNALVDTGAQCYLIINKGIANKIQKALQAPHDKLTVKATTFGHQPKDQQKGIPVTDVIQAHITIQGVKFLNEPFVEVPTSTDIIIGNLWLADHAAAPDCRTRQLHWLDRKSESAPLTKDIAINLRNQPKMSWPSVRC